MARSGSGRCSVPASQAQAQARPQQLRQWGPAPTCAWAGEETFRTARGTGAADNDTRAREVPRAVLLSSRCRIREYRSDVGTSTTALTPVGLPLTCER